MPPTLRWSIAIDRVEEQKRASRDGRAAAARARARRRARGNRAAGSAGLGRRDQAGSISKLMSMAGAECVSAPTDTKSAPVAASSGIRSSVTPPEISIFARPRARDRRPRESSRSDMLSTRIVSAPAASASSTCASVSASISTGKPGRCARARLYGRLHAARKTDVVVLDQHRVEETDAVVRRAAGADGVLLERAQRRRRLARVEDGDAAARRLDEPARARGDAREPLQKVERGPFADEQRPRGADHLRDLLARAAGVAIAPGGRKRGHGAPLRRGHLSKCFERDLQAGEDAIGLHQEDAARHRGRRDCRIGRDVAVADVLFERAAHDVAIERRDRETRDFRLVQTSDWDSDRRAARSRSRQSGAARPRRSRTPARAVPRAGRRRRSASARSRQPRLSRSPW